MSNSLKEHLTKKIPILDDATYYIPANVSTIDEYKRTLVYEETTVSEDKPILNVNFNIDENIKENDNIISNLYNKDENIFTHSISIDDEDEESTSSSDSIIIDEITIENTKEKTDLFVECIPVSLDDELISLDLDFEEDSSTDEETITIENISNDESIEELSNNLSSLFDGNISIDDIDFTDELMVANDLNYNKNQGALEEDMSYVNKIKDANDITDEDDFVDLMGKINLSNFKKDEKKDELL